jgi:Co/Zn/Cd efflux system component
MNRFEHKTRSVVILIVLTMLVKISFGLTTRSMALLRASGKFLLDMQVAADFRGPGTTLHLPPHYS